MGWAIVEEDTMPPHIKDGCVRDESVQAAEVTDLLRLFDRAGVDATFVFVFSAPMNVHCEDPRYDFDMASYALVKSFANRLGDAATKPPLADLLPLLPWDADRSGTTYPDMPWEPKEAFGAVSRFYGARARTSA